MRPDPNHPHDPKDPNAPLAPLRQWLEPAIDEPRIARAWQRIRSAQATTMTTTRPTPSRRPWRWLAAPIGLCACAAALWLLWLRPSGSGEALRAVDEQVSLSAGAEVGYAADVIALRDGSRMILEQEAQLQVLENDGQRFVASLRRGTARLAVQPGPRRWTIETELATIEVIGAIVTIAHHEHMVRVSVQRGVVMVRGERVPGRVARLIAGQGLSVVAEETAATPAIAPATPAIAPATPAPAIVPPATVPSSNLAEPAPSPATAPAQPAPSSIVGPRRAIKEAKATAPAKPRTLLDPAPASPTESGAPASHASSAVPPLSAPSEPIASTSTARALRDADQLRRSGDAQAAATLLEDARRQRPDDPAGGMVEYSLGRLYLNHLGEPGRAARVFSAVIDRGSPQPLIEGAMALRCEALWRSGDRAAARSALDEYQRRYPNGSRLAGLTTLLSSEP